VYLAYFGACVYALAYNYSVLLRAKVKFIRDTYQVTF